MNNSVFRTIIGVHSRGPSALRFGRRVWRLVAGLH